MVVVVSGGDGVAAVAMVVYVVVDVVVLPVVAVVFSLIKHSVFVLALDGIFWRVEILTLRFAGFWTHVCASNIRRIIQGSLVPKSCIVLHSSFCDALGKKLVKSVDKLYQSINLQINQSTYQSSDLPIFIFLAKFSS